MKSRARDKIFPPIETVYGPQVFYAFSRKGLEKLGKLHSCDLTAPEGCYGCVMTAVNRSIDARICVLFVDLDKHVLMKNVTARANVGGTVLHEAIHIKQNVARWASADFDTETEAYFIENLYLIIMADYHKVLQMEREQRKSK